MKLPAKVRMFDVKTSKPSGEYCPIESGTESALCCCLCRFVKIDRFKVTDYS